jgi:hypothetical protein
MAETCHQVRQATAELALGISDGQERARALSHLEDCAACRAELRSLSDTADALALLTPAAEPPPGFESHVVAAVAAGTTTDKTSSGRRRLLLAVAGAVAAAAVALGLLLTSGGPTAPSDASAPLVAHHQVLGRLLVSSGPRPWVSMVLDTGHGDGTVTCQLQLTGGEVATVGTFTLRHGYAYWAAPLHVPLRRIVAARLLSHDGRVLATATVPAASSAG